GGGVVGWLLVGFGRLRRGLLQQLSDRQVTGGHQAACHRDRDESVDDNCALHDQSRVLVVRLLGQRAASGSFAACAGRVLSETGLMSLETRSMIAGSMAAAS